MVAPHDIQLRWAVIEDQLREISDFAHLAPSKRPAASCPICNRDVTMKLGEIRAYHIAHQPDETCIATNPETALHLNMKFYIAEQLRQDNRLFIEEKCKNCHSIRNQLKFSGWNQVEVERTIGDPYRPDIVLLVDGQPVGAIEVFVTHKVDEKKARYYTLRQIEWIEVVGEETFYDGPLAWTADKPMPFYRIHPPLKTWQCPECQTKEQALNAEKELLRKQQEYRKNNYDEVIYARLVDFYYPSGKKWREWYFIKRRIKNGGIVGCILTVKNGDILSRQPAPFDFAAIDQLKNACQLHIDTKGPQGTVVDQHMQWRLWLPDEKFYISNFERFPFRFEWDDKKRVWIQRIKDTWR